MQTVYKYRSINSKERKHTIKKMSLAVVNETTVTTFVEDMKAFENCVKECFEMLDVDGDGVLSRSELREGFCKLMSLGHESSKKEKIDHLFDTIFDRFDEDQSGSIDPREFKCLIRELMFAMGRGFGNSPVLVALEIDSLLMKAVEHEFGQI
jgi:Ca2+-binding EF-hand superfamily protein